MSKILNFNMYSFQKQINEALSDKEKKDLVSKLKIYCDELGSDFREVCKIMKIKTSGVENLSEFAIKYLDSGAGKGKWTYNEKTGKVDVEGIFENTWNSELVGQLPSSLSFGTINGTFNVSGSNFR
jgi:hypothetical protein